MAKNDIILKVAIDGAKEELSNLALLQDAINQLSIEKKDLTVRQKELSDAIKAGTITEEEAEQQNIALAQSQVELNIELKETKKEYADAEKALRNGIQTQKTNEGSIASMRLELSKAQQEYIGLSKEERENEKIGGALQKQIKAQSDELKDLEKEIGITSRSVGDYGSAVNGVLPLMGGFGQSIQQIIGNLGQIKTALGKFSAAQKASAAATNGTNSSLKAFRIALISAGIGAIVVALGTLIGAFLSTQRGADALSRALGPVKEIFQTLIGLIQNQAIAAFDGFKRALKDPVQGLKDLGNLIKDSFVTRFEGAVNFLKANVRLVTSTFKLIGLGIKKELAGIPILGGGIDEAQVKKDLEFAKKEAIQAAKDVAVALVQVNTGLDKEAQKGLLKVADEAGNRGAIITELQIEIQKNAVNLNRIVAQGRREFEEQKKIAEDINLSDQERVNATRKAQQILQQITKIEEDQLDREIRLKKLQAEANDTDYEAQKEISDLEAEKDRIKAENIAKSIEIRNKENTIIQQGIAAEKKAVEDAKKAKEEELKKAEKEAKDAAKLQLERDKSVINSKISALESARKLDALKNAETEEEKYKKDIDLLNKKAELKLQLAKVNGENIAEVEIENEIALEERKKEERDRIAELEIESIKERQERINEIRYQGFQAADELSSAYFDNQDRRIKDNQKREIDALNLKKQAGIISQEEYEAARLELDRKAFEEQKKADKKRAIINGALAVTKVFSTTPFPASLGAAALVGLKTGIELAKISSQKFSKGGKLVGASHENGGIPINVGGNMVEAEGGEIIINKNSSKKHLGLLSAINQDGGGVPLARRGMALPSVSGLRRFASGGVVPTSSNPTSNLASIEDVATLINSTVGNLKVINVASETSDVASRVAKIQNSAQF